MTSPGANDVLRRFNRETALLLVGLLGVVLFAALAFAFFIPEPRSATAGIQGRASQAKTTPSLTADVPELDSSAKKSPSQVSSGTLTHVDQGSAESSSKESHPPPEVTVNATPVPVPMPSIATVNPKESQRVFRGTASYRRGNSTRVLGEFEIKKRLIELWHQSLARIEKSQSWTTFSQLERRKKAAFTARKQP